MVALYFFLVFLFFSQRLVFSKAFEQLLQPGDNESGTLHLFFKILSWSFQCLLSGTFPAFNWDGKPFPEHSLDARRAGTELAGGFKGVLVAIQGDLDFYASAMNLPRWNVNKGGCPLCKCVRHGADTWFVFNDSARISNLEWIAAEWHSWPSRSTCPIFAIPSLSACNIMLDYLHLKYLGTDMYQYGGLFFYMTFFLLPQQPKDNLAYLWSRMQYWYKQLRITHKYHHFNRLTMYVRKSGPPKLRGRGAEVMGLCKVCVKIWDKKIESHRMILEMLRSNARMEEILEICKGESCLPADEAKQFVDAAFRMAHLNHLVFDCFKHEADMKGSFTVTMKLHMILHVALHAHEISPRLTWNFTGEDNMGVLKRLGQNCVKGSQPEDATSEMLQHWRFAMHQKLTEG